MQHSTAQDAGWPTYGGDPGGQRFSPANEITLSNLSNLRVAWTFHTHDTESGHIGSFESTPILFHDHLYFTTPTNVVFAVDPATGLKVWQYDPKVDFRIRFGITTSRGVSAWTTKHPSGSTCDSRIFFGTLDGRLLSLDADTGEPCSGFGQNGNVDLTRDVDFRKGDFYSITSPPAIIDNTVVVGSGLEDNRRVDIERGDVRGFDAVTGRLLWTWDPLPWANKQTLRTGGANTWGPIAVDAGHHLVLPPTSSPSPDYYGGLRPGDNRDADSVVALDSSTGQKIWAFLLVHHDVWDYDVAAEPLLFDYGNTPAVAVASKTGMLFILNRLTGKPLFPATERPVPTGNLRGEVLSPTQPFSALPPLSPLTMDLSKPLGLTPEDDRWCRAEIAQLRFGGVFTPPSEEGTVLFPSNVGGVNWGSMAFDPLTSTIYANTNRIPFRVRMIRTPWLRPKYLKLGVGLIVLLVLLLIVLRVRVRAGWGGAAGVVFSVLLLAFLVIYHQEAIQILLTDRGWGISGIYQPHFGREFGEDSGAPYQMLREPFEHNQIPCAPTPWGAVAALNLKTGTMAWETPLGSKVNGRKTGNWSVGGPIVTAGGLLFTAAVPEPYIRAFDLKSGKEVWKADLPAPAQATPMTYLYKGRQYVVIAAGGHPGLGNSVSDTLVAFALP